MPASVHIGGEGDGRRLDHNQMTDSTRDDVVYEGGETKREDMIDFSHLMASLNQTPHELPKVARLLACFSQVSFPWNDIFNKPLSPELDVLAKPDVLSSELPSQGKQSLSLTVWMIKQASPSDLHLGLYSLVRYLLPLLLNTDLQWRRHLILDLVESIFEKPGALTKLENHPFWRKQCLIPPSSFDNLLRLKFPATGEDKTRFVKIYGSLKRVALAGALKRKAIIQQIFTVSLRLAGEGNHVLAKEAAEMATWSLTKNYYVCWRLWYKISKENQVASVILLKTLLEKWNKHSLKLPSSSPPHYVMSVFIQSIFTVSLRLAGEGNPIVARNAAAYAIWALNKNIVGWRRCTISMRRRI
ncbi:hypothetical protein Bca4012_035896 [Brassica carinata]